MYHDLTSSGSNVVKCQKARVHHLGQFKEHSNQFETIDVEGSVEKQSWWFFFVSVRKTHVYLVLASLMMTTELYP